MEHIFNTTLAQLKQKLQEGNWTDILNNVCFIKENEVVIDYMYFKHFANGETYNFILSTIVNNIDSILNMNDKFVVHINMKSLGISDFEKHRHFIQSIADFFKERYDGKLIKCYIYNAPFIFSQVFNIIIAFIDKETQNKIVVIDNKNKQKEEIETNI
jgi:hypothetical protein